jgi:alpha-ketoglutarate-dependent 2,4-dichlorophenoxyacetate dioxygenase
MLARQGTEPPRDVTAEAIYPELRCLFEAHSLLLFRGQSIDEVKHRTLASLFGPLENLTDAGPDKTPSRPMVSNLAPNGTLAGEAELTTSPQPPRN